MEYRRPEEQYHAHLTGYEYFKDSDVWVVVNPLLRRGSEIHDNVFRELKAINANQVRFQYWYPYPHLVVAELEAPQGNPRCAVATNDTWLRIYCGTTDGLIEDIQFASFGDPTGSCGNFQMGRCNSDQSLQVVKNMCLGKQSCSIPANIATFGKTCNTPDLRLAVQASCSNARNVTSWDFSYMDPLMEDFMDATGGRNMILDMSTIPAWMFNTKDPITYSSDPNAVNWGYQGPTLLRDPSMKELVTYFQRILSWYTKGGFYDEYGVYHHSGHNYKFSHWEVLNEVDLGFTGPFSVEYYTQIYDAIVLGLREIDPNMQYVGLALAGHYEWSWYTYFLNASNHAPGVPLDWISFHYYTFAKNRTDSQSFEDFFAPAEDFVKETREIIKIRDSLSPQTKIDIDELGVVLPGDPFDVDVKPIPDSYWNAAGAMFAYVWAGLALDGVEFVGESQMVGFPTQWPSVSMVNWTTGIPNSRYRVLQLLLENVQLEDEFVTTTSSDDSSIFGQAYVSENSRKILLVNRRFQKVQVNLEGVVRGNIAYVDVTTKENPPAFKSFKGSSIFLEPFCVAIVTLT
eukprot:TRINITY_DN5017_c0_g1_i4.p1 TRINITY_DN5017_c0_g1~~TRINITY_DN5017_c0_g1_i4.p1  ORF type:complete len:571 (-),score=139.84 TRINITY_DN5017_c0_g1_i4:68-1780(-)